VIFFEMPNHCWNTELVAATRLLHDSLVGIAYPLKGRTLSAAKERKIRQRVAQFCTKQLGKPYNFNLLDKEVDSAFYCSQLVYQAYLEQGIDLLQRDTQAGKKEAPLIITPQMIWDGCVHQTVDGATPV
jgi:cell wall-associated NlpC family hydrolase